jgi:anionic cell wall polymer biosynthesis LytR-Cps2A-Psr (LCP) family protein
VRIKTFIVVPFFILAVLAVSGIIIFNFFLKTETKKKAGNIDYETKITGENKTQLGNALYEPVNIAVFGLDEENVRTDLIIVVNFNPNNGKISIISVPRDTKVYIDNKINKINAIIPIKGKNSMIKILEEITGDKINFYINFNLKGFKDMVDCLEGVYFNGRACFIGPALHGFSRGFPRRPGDARDR